MNWPVFIEKKNDHLSLAQYERANINEFSDRRFKTNLDLSNLIIYHVMNQKGDTLNNKVCPFYFAQKVGAFLIE